MGLLISARSGPRCLFARNFLFLWHCCVESELTNVDSVNATLFVQVYFGLNPHPSSKTPSGLSEERWTEDVLRNALTLLVVAETKTLITNFTKHHAEAFVLPAGAVSKRRLNTGLIAALPLITEQDFLGMLPAEWQRSPLLCNYHTSNCNGNRFFYSPSASFKVTSYCRIYPLPAPSEQPSLDCIWRHCPASLAVTISLPVTPIFVTLKNSWALCHEPDACT